VLAGRETLPSRPSGLDKNPTLARVIPMIAGAKRAAKIDAYIEQYLNGRSPDAPPPEHPITSQIEGELRELRVRFATESRGRWCATRRPRLTRFINLDKLPT
jgi:hypothetical protein